MLEKIGSYPKVSHSIETISTPDEVTPYYVIKNDRTRKFLKIGESEYRILMSLSGKASLTQLHDMYKDYFEAEKINELITNLYKLRLLEQDYISEDVEKELTPAQRFIANFNYEKIFKIKLKMGEPDKFLTRVYPFIRFFFNKIFFFFSLIASIYGIYSTLTKPKVLLNGLWETVENGEILFLLVPMVLIFVFHELAHGLATKHFGGVVYEIGFMLFYFRPAAYCNISDSYRFKKWQRLVVYGVGLYFQLFLVSLLLIGWDIAGNPFGLGGRLLVSFCAMNLFLVLMNLIPLIKLDGYWILSTLLNIDNLRMKSFDFLNNFISNKVFGIRKSSYLFKQSSTKEKTIYVLYGVSSIIFTVALIFSIAVEFGSFLVLRLGMLGFIIFFVSVLFLLVRAVAFILSMLVATFKSGIKTVLRFAIITILVGVTVSFGLSNISLNYDVDAIYRLTDGAKNADSEKEADEVNPIQSSVKANNSKSAFIKIYLNKSDVEDVTKGKKITVSIYRSGHETSYEGIIISEKPGKELFFNTGINVTQNPGLFVGIEKYTFIAQISNPNTLFKEVKSGTVTIKVGKVKVSKYLAGIIRKLTPG